MTDTEQEYLERLRRHAADTRTLLSNPSKPERERMVVRAFLRSIGEPFSEPEICAAESEPVDVVFRSARFQIRDFVGDKKRGLDWRNRQDKWESAKTLSDLLEPSTSGQSLSLGSAAEIVARGLSEKALKYGSSCKSLDCLAYMDLRGRHLYSMDDAPIPEVMNELERQGWRSVSMLFPPYGLTLLTSQNAPTFLLERAGRVFNEWPHLDGLFDA